jgi:hypothetical protein
MGALEAKLKGILEMHSVSKKALRGIPNVALWRVLRKLLHKLSIIQNLERWIVCTPLSVNVFLTLATD